MFYKTGTATRFFRKNIFKKITTLTLTTLTLTTLTLKLKTMFKPLRWYTVCTPFLHAYTLII